MRRRKKEKEESDDEFSEWDEDTEDTENKAKYWFTRDKMDKIIKVHDCGSSSVHILPPQGSLILTNPILLFYRKKNKVPKQLYLSVAQ